VVVAEQEATQPLVLVEELEFLVKEHLVQEVEEGLAMETELEGLAALMEQMQIGQAQLVHHQKAYILQH
jgi:hypothetical protein